MDSRVVSVIGEFFSLWKLMIVSAKSVPHSHCTCVCVYVCVCVVCVCVWCVRCVRYDYQQQIRGPIAITSYPRHMRLSWRDSSYSNLGLPDQNKQGEGIFHVLVQLVVRDGNTAWHNLCGMHFQCTFIRWGLLYREIPSPLQHACHNTYSLYTYI